jgi:hypothetical protein
VQVLQGVPRSGLSPHVTRLPPYIRLASAPVYGPSNLNKNYPDGAIIAGDVVRGHALLHDSCPRCKMMTDEGPGLLSCAQCVQLNGKTAGVNVHGYLPWV